jgi:hypothetical protein
LSDSVAPVTPDEQKLYDGIAFDVDDYRSDVGTTRLINDGDKVKMLMARFRMLYNFSSSSLKKNHDKLECLSSANLSSLVLSLLVRLGAYPKALYSERLGEFKHKVGMVCQPQTLQLIFPFHW